MRTMKAAVFICPGKIALEEKPIPVVGPGEALIKITTTTICGTDVRWCDYTVRTVLKVAITP